MNNNEPTALGARFELLAVAADWGEFGNELPVEHTMIPVLRQVWLFSKAVSKSARSFPERKYEFS